MTHNDYHTMTVIHRNDCHNDYVAIYEKTKMTVTMTMSQHKMTKFSDDHYVTVLSEMTVTVITVTTGRWRLIFRRV